MSGQVETLGALILFSQNFRKFRFGRKWNAFRPFVPLEKVDNLKRWARFPGWNFPNGISCSIYSFLVLYTSFNCYQLGNHLSVPSGSGLSAVPGFTIKWNNFLPIGKSIFVATEISGFFYLNGKRPLSVLTCLKSYKPPAPSLPPSLPPPHHHCDLPIPTVYCVTNGHANWWREQYNTLTWHYPIL